MTDPTHPELIMIKRPNRAALPASMLLAATLAAAPLDAQATDSTRRWALFGGLEPAERVSSPTFVLHNLEFGGSGDFRIAAFPLPLRATLAFSHTDQPFRTTNLKFGTLTLDAIGRPVPKFLGTQLYLLAGIGIGTQAPYTAFVSRPVSYDPYLTEGSVIRRPRQSWALVEGGVGLDVGRLFVQVKGQAPVASNGPWRAPFSFGFRF
jgi:hypothetical protein